jgi:2-polyprenyl-3-methyl-5-hydroxy-6-metoxy-1,4-benzoquinol methylase
MKELKQFPTTDYTKFPQKYYFESIAKNIIKIGNLKNTNKVILDFGCGQKIFSKILKEKKIINYDIKPEYTECQTYEDYLFDIVIFNHVLMYFYPNQIKELLNKIKKMRPNCELVLSLGKQNIISKIAMYLTLNFNYHDDIRSTYKEQMKVFFDQTILLKKKKNIFFMTDVYYFKFKN